MKVGGVNDFVVFFVGIKTCKYHSLTTGTYSGMTYFIALYI